MAGPDDQAEHLEIETEHISARNSRNGLVLFILYLALYGGFMYLNAFNLERMGQPAVGGVNLAIVYGFGLIVAALLLAFVYMYLCRASAPDGETGR